MTTTPQDPESTTELAEMHDVVTKVVQLFLDNCPEGFAADDVAAAIVDVCSDEMHRLYAAKTERDQYRTKLIAEGYLSDDQPGTAGCGAPMAQES